MSSVQGIWKSIFKRLLRAYLLEYYSYCLSNNENKKNTGNPLTRKTKSGHNLKSRNDNTQKSSKCCIESNNKKCWIYGEKWCWLKKALILWTYFTTCKDCERKFLPSLNCLPGHYLQCLQHLPNDIFQIQIQMTNVRRWI